MTDPPAPPGRTLTDADVEAVALRTAELLREHTTAHLVDTATLATRLSVSPDWVRDHAAELGGVRIGDSPRSPLRFDPALADRAIVARRVPAATRRRTTGRRGSRTGEGFDLIPIPARATKERPNG